MRTFERLGLKAVPVRADTGPIGGDLSHEFLILADTGESEIGCHADFVDMDLRGADLNYDNDDDMQRTVDHVTSLYAAVDEQRDDGVEKSLGNKLKVQRGIEVGHIFSFGTKYSAAMGATVNGPDGESTNLECGSYGIGVSRLVAGIIEASHDENGIVWPESVAPFKVGLINLKANDEECASACDNLYARLTKAGVEVLYDDRGGRAGVKFADMDLIGLPWQLIIGPRGLKTGVVELKNRKSGEREEIGIDDAFARLAG